jgi:pimeloyl-ACP methyl ester carboxylesterase
VDVVLLHSGVTDAREWDAVRPLLAGEHRVVAPELWQARPLVDIVLDAMPSERAALVGTSFGGGAALAAAVAAPDRVEKVALINTNPFGWSDDVRSVGEREQALYDAGDLDGAARLMVDAWLVGPRRRPSDLPQELRDYVFEAQRRAYEAEEPERSDFDFDAVSVPLLYIRGELDWPDVERASQRFPRVEVVAGAAHLPTLERPDEVVRLLLDFLGGEE